MEQLPPRPPYQSAPQPPPGYYYPPTYPQSMPPAARKTDGIAISGFVLSLASVGLFLIPVMNVAVAVMALVFSIIGIRNTRDPTRGGRGLAIAGTVIAPLVIFMGIFYTIGFISAFTEGA